LQCGIASYKCDARGCGHACLGIITSITQMYGYLGAIYTQGFGSDVQERLAGALTQIGSAHSQQESAVVL